MSKPRRGSGWILATILLAGGVSSLRRGGAANASEPFGLASRPLEPQLFAAGIVSTEDDERGGTFNPEGTEFYFGKLGPYTTFPRIGIICVSRLRDGRWAPPEVVPFSGRYLDFPPRMAPDGRRMYFASSRPVPGLTIPAIRIWSVDRDGETWTEPLPLAPPVNAPPDRWNLDPSVTSSGTLYFSSDREEQGRFQIYRSRFVDGRYQAPEKLDGAVNSPYSESEAFVSPDERTLMFVSTGLQGPPYAARPQDLVGAGARYPRGDLYVSEARNGVWTPARHIGHRVNTVAEESFPSLTPDGRFLFFTSDRSPFDLPIGHRMGHAEIEGHLHSLLNGHGNIYFVSSEVLERHE